MKNIFATALVAVLLVPFGAGAEGSRLRLENGGRDGQVRIVQSDERVSTVELSIPGGASGELVTVEAPALQVRLAGGSIDGDPLLEAMVAEKVRQSAPRSPTVLVLQAPSHFQPDSDRYLNSRFAEVGYAYTAGYGVGYGYATGFGTGSGYSPRRSGCEVQPRHTRSSRPAAATRPSGGRASGHGMLPHR